MFNEIIIGAQNVSDGVATKARGGAGDQLVSDLHGRYYEQTYRRNTFNVATVAAGVTTVGLATTYTGLMLQNPYTSTINVVLNKCTFMQSVIQATTLSAVGIAFGYGRSQCHVGYGGGYPQQLHRVRHRQPGQRGNHCISSAPFYHTFLANSQTAILNNNPVYIDLEGLVILPPRVRLLGDGGGVARVEHVVQLQLGRSADLTGEAHGRPGRRKNYRWRNHHGRHRANHARRTPTAYTANDVVGLWPWPHRSCCETAPDRGRHRIIIRRSCSIAWTPRRTRNFDLAFRHVKPDGGGGQCRWHDHGSGAFELRRRRRSTARRQCLHGRAEPYH